MCSIWLGGGLQNQVESGAMLRTNSTALRTSGVALMTIFLKKPKFACFDYEFDFSLIMDDFTDVIDDMAYKCNGKIVLEGRFIS